jgi:hypothetical protein
VSLSEDLTVPSLCIVQAQRAVSASGLGSRPGTMATLDATLPSIFPQAAGIISQQASNPLGPERESQYVRRIRELEEELRLSRVENEKNVRFCTSSNI